jgi:hypothetical protein
VIERPAGERQVAHAAPGEDREHLVDLGAAEQAIDADLLRHPRRLQARLARRAHHLHVAGRAALLDPPRERAEHVRRNADILEPDVSQPEPADLVEHIETVRDGLV